jgi:hypothetical protein
MASSGGSSATASPSRMRVGRVVERARTWPSAVGLAWFERRFGLYLVTICALYGLLWTRGFDLHAYLTAAKDVAAGNGAYAATLATGPEHWGDLQVYVSPPFVAHMLAPFSHLPFEVVAVGWAILGLAAVGIAILALPDDTVARRMPRYVFSFGYLWSALALGQVDPIVLAGLLVALGARDDRASGFGLAVAVLLRGAPALFALELVLERRWRALGWAAVFFLAGLLVSGGSSEWLTWVDVTRRISTIATLDVFVQTSLARFGPGAVAIAGLAIVIVLALAARRPGEARLLRATAIGLAIVLLPANTWAHWLSFALVGLLLWGDSALWSRRAVAAFIAASLLVQGWISVLVAVVTLASMTWRVIHRPTEADLPVSVSSGTPSRR